jgi:hypothetical protein
MRMCLLAAISLALLSPAVLAQSPEMPAGAIGRPPPLPGPPPLMEPSPATTPTTTAPAPQTSQPAPKGYTGAYAPSAEPPPPYSAGPLPSVSEGPGLNVVGPDGVSTKTVKAVPCGVVARETDGFTTCVGIPDEQPKKRR